MTIRKSVYQIIEADDRFSILLEILNRTGIGRAMQHEDRPFTFFAPTDGAFYRMFQSSSGEDSAEGRKILVASILGNHIIPSVALYSDDLRRRESVQSLDGKNLPLRSDDNRLFIGEAQIVSPAVPAENGVVFAVDRVLFAPADNEMQRAGK
jgi:uncharacterized surface protein with fasciclin (FAS1) repeats